LSSTGTGAGLITAVSRAANSAAASLEAVVTGVFADANVSQNGNQSLEIGAAAQVQWTDPGASEREFLIINNATFGFQRNADIVIEITGVNGMLNTASFI
jgi:hypothetical protein